MASPNDGYSVPTKSNTGKIVLIVCLIIGIPCLALLGVCSYAIFRASKDVFPVMGCMVTMDALRSAAQEYAHEHGGKLPEATNWQSELKPYLEKTLNANAKDLGPIKPVDPSSSVWFCTETESAKTGIAYNSDIAGKVAADIPNPTTTMLFFETDKAMQNLAMSYKPLPKASSPKIMGQPRGWIEIPLEGEIKGFDGNTKDLKIGTDRGWKVEVAK